MPRITIDLIRRKAEHNEGLIHTLEELSLHQEELEEIDETLGCNCRRLKILYLQNNIIGEMKNLHHMKELEYLNLALNNISKVQGLRSCEFLNKLDLTVNFVDLDELESSVTAMAGCEHLADLYMMGNPCQSWAGFEAYVVARLPQLERLDGKEITRTDRIKAQQRLPTLRDELSPLAEEVRRRKRDENQASRERDQDGKLDATSEGGGEGETTGDGGHPPAPSKGDGDGRGGGSELGEEELTKHTPEVRTAIYREMAQQKKEKDDRQRENLPRDRNFELEQAAAVESARRREAEGIIRQCNEGKLDFRFEETRAASLSSPGSGGRRGTGDIILEVAVPKHLDSSLIDLDVHPHYVSIVIKGKVLRLSLQAEVIAGEAKARRSKTTGSLVVTMPKVNPHQSIGLVPTNSRRRAPGVVADRAAASKSASRNDAGRTKRRSGAPPPLAALMMEEAQAAAASRKGSQGGSSGGPAETPLQAVSIRGIVDPRHGGLAVDADAPQLSEVTSSLKRAACTGDGVNSDTRTTSPASGTRKKTGGEPAAADLPEPPAACRNPPRQPNKGTTPPAPPSGNSVPVSGAADKGERTRVVWPRDGEEDDEAVAAECGLSRLDALD